MSQVHAKALRRAAEILGGTDKLRDYLQVPLSQLELWLSGAERPPVDVFLRAVDLISGTPDPAPTSEAIWKARRHRD